MSEQDHGLPPHSARRFRDERGAVAVEMAFLLPLLVMLLVGIIEFGRGWDAKLAVSAAVREGSRAAATGGDPVAAAKAAAAGLDPAKLTVLTTIPAPNCPITEYAYVTVRYPFTIEVPFLPARTMTLESKSVMRCGG